MIKRVRYERVCVSVSVCSPLFFFSFLGTEENRHLSELTSSPEDLKSHKLATFAPLLDLHTTKAFTSNLPSFYYI